jgi:superfamily II DNA/RNA helicase
MMTGTPAAQSPVEAYGLAKLVNPTGVPKYFTSFKDMVMTKVSMHRWLPKPNAQNIVYTALQPAIRHTKKECLDLPDMTYVSRDVELTPQQKKFYDLLKKKLVVQAAGEEVTSVNAAVNLNKLLQISCGAVYSDSGEVLMFDIDKRYKVLREVIDETQQKILIFAPFKHVIKVLHEKLEADGFSTDIINGEVSAGLRTDIFKQFQETPDPRILVIQPQAAAHGVTLTAANTIIWYAPVTSTETYLQANARIDRPGQVNNMTVVHITGSPIETKMYKLLQGNISNHQKVIDLYRQEISPETIDNVKS